MTNQTLPNDKNNRGEKSLKALENELRTIWLTLADALRTASIGFDENKMGAIKEILVLAKRQ